MSEPEFDIDEDIDAAIAALDEDDLTQIILMSNQIVGDLNALLDPEVTQRLAFRAFVAGYTAGLSQSPQEPQEASTDLLIGITPEDAATIVAGLLGDGTTLTLSVIRQG